MSKRVAIIGSGIAGLSAAQKLFKNGFKDVMVFEAMQRIGGRIHTIPFDNSILELGAQWLHGEEGNPLYQLAKDLDLLSDPDSDNGVEGQGIFCTDLGDVLNHELVNQVISYLNLIKKKISNKELTTSNIPAEQIFRQFLKKYIDSPLCPFKCWHLKWSVFEWFLKFEVIDNSCDDLNSISALSYTEWCDCSGISLINFKHGFKALIDSMLNDIPNSSIRLNTHVKRIEIYGENKCATNCVKLTIEQNGETMSTLFDHVIVTSSLGYIQQNLQTFLGFEVPQKKVDLINSLGFGTINKIYLIFENPFWKIEDKGFQLIWTKKYANFPNWVYDITGFDVVREQPRVLCGWIGGKGGQMIERESNELVGNICAQVLQMFLKRVNIEPPKQVILSKWFTNSYICGAYSNRSIDYERGNFDITDYQQPIEIPTQASNLNKSINCPAVMFAGEATDKQFYSTTHGAFRSGWREANRLIQFYQTLNANNSAYDR